ncbi:MAG TPA: pyruvate dehydrogenase, partial [Eubacteriaceae bacterium]|nr:pyruvate dehydrogenase [Eubacteriaceae bacterium]
DGNDAIEIYETLEKAAEEVRSGKGPVLIESKTYRWLGHSKSDAQAYRTKEEVEEWKEKDPIARLKKYMIDNDIATEEEIDQVKKDAKSNIEAAVKFAEESPEPPIESVTEDVYA